MNTEQSSKDGKYYTDIEIAGLLGISLGRLRNKLCAGSPLPPRIQPPGFRHRLWPCQAVHDLNYQLIQLCRCNRDGSYCTRTDRAGRLNLIANQGESLSWSIRNSIIWCVSAN